MQKIETEVVILGGGPVGTGLAIELGQRGIDVVLIERYPQPQMVPKGQNLTQRTMEHFHFWGVEKELRAARTIPPEYGIGGLTAYRTLLGGYHHDWLQRELVRPFYYTDNERLPQYRTEQVLRQRASALPTVRILYGFRGEDVVQGEQGVLVLASDMSSGERVTVDAQYAVGCDGSKSMTRESVGMTQTIADHDRLMVLLVFRSAGLHELLKRFPGKSFYNVLNPALGGYWQFLGRVDLGNSWFFHAPVPLGTTKDNFDFVGYLHEAVDASFDVAFEHIGFWDLRMAIADQYRMGRVFIAGDAAHSHPPYGGYGINTGFEDARNLGWKLAARLRGWGAEPLLDSYQAERQPVFLSTMRDFIARSIASDGDFLAQYDPSRDLDAFESAWKARSSGAQTEVNAFQPHYSGSSIVWGNGDSTSGAVSSHAFEARPGYHLAPAALSSGDNVYQRLGQGFTLLAFGAEEGAGEAFATAARQTGVPLDVVADDRAGERERYQARLVLVRPDQFVAWAGDEIPGDCTAILAKSSGQDMAARSCSTEGLPAPAQSAR